MKNVQSKIEELKEKIVPVLKKYPVIKAGLFGSVVRGDDTPESDVDILVDIDASGGFDLFDLVNLKQTLESALNRKVDLVNYQTIKEQLKKYIIPAEVRIYEKNN